MKRSPQVLVIGDSDASAVEYQAAVEVGAMIARLGAVTITGGLAGVMEAASRGAREQGGLVVGIIPGLDPATANAYTSVIIPSGMGHMRNILNVQAADAVITIGGKAGTLSELAFAWIQSKPVFALTGFGGWSDQLAGRGIDDRTSDVIEPCESLSELEGKLKNTLTAQGFRLP